MKQSQKKKIDWSQFFSGVPESFGSRAVGIGGDMVQVISDLNQRNCS